MRLFGYSLLFNRYILRISYVYGTYIIRIWYVIDKGKIKGERGKGSRLKGIKNRTLMKNAIFLIVVGRVREVWQVEQLVFTLQQPQ